MSTHNAHSHAEHNVGNQVDETRERIEAVVNHGKDVADARQHLEAVVEDLSLSINQLDCATQANNETVVTGVRLDLALHLDVDLGRRDGTAAAQPCLEVIQPDNRMISKQASRHMHRQGHVLSHPQHMHSTQLLHTKPWQHE